MKKYFGSILIVILSVFCMVCVGCSTGDDGGTSGLDYYQLDDGTYGVRIGTMTELSSIKIATKHNGKNVSEILESGFAGGKLKNITIPSTIITIHKNAFMGCESLETITVPNSVTHIGESAFSGCKNLNSATIGSAVTQIGKDAFSGCSSLKTFYWNAINCQSASNIFSKDKQITEVKIGKAVKVIPYNLFASVSTVEHVYYSGSKEDWKKIDIQSGNTPLTNAMMHYDEIDESQEHDTYNFEYEENGYTLMGVKPEKIQMTSAEIPGEFNGQPVTTIRSNAFKNCSKLKSVIIPDSVASIGNSAFSGCSSLTSITLPFVGGSAIATNNAPLGYIFGKDSYTGGTATAQYYDRGYYGSHYEIYYIPKSLMSVTITGGNILHSSAFSGCRGLTSITIPDSVTSIGDYAFDGCSGLTSITIPDPVTSIGDYAFYGCSGLTSITIPDSVTSIGDHAFPGCSGLTSITIPDSMTSIGDYAFTNCSGLTSITIGNGVMSIGDKAFYGCIELANVYYKGTASQWKNISKGSDIWYFTSATLYYYSEKPTTSGNYWHYGSDGVTPIAW